MRVSETVNATISERERGEAPDVAARMVRNVLASAGRVERIDIVVTVTSEIRLTAREE